MRNQTFKFFLNEPPVHFTESSELSDFADIRNINPSYFAKFGDEPLLRGIRQQDLGPVISTIQLDDYWFVDVRKLKVRKDRKPLTTNARISAMLDEWFVEKFGVAARSRAVFCVSLIDGTSFNTAFSYGTANIVIPIGHADYIWAENSSYDDLYNAWFEWRMAHRVSNTDATSEHIDEFLTAGNYVKNADTQSLQDVAGLEIMVDCDEYIALTIRDEDGIPSSQYRNYAKLAERLNKGA